MRLNELGDRIANAQGLDTVGGAVRDAVHKVLRPGAVKDALHGVWLGHPLHPALAQLAAGLFTGAALLDARGDRGDAPARLIRWGLLASVPTAAAGLADYADGHEEQQRLGVVHAAANSASVLCYVASLGIRATGRRQAGALVGLAGFALVAASAAVGGDMAFRRAMGPNHAAEVPHAGPGDWVDIGGTTEFGAVDPVRRMAGLIPVVVVRSGETFSVLHDRCSHMAAPLHQGDLVDVDGKRCLVCPWHGSVFGVEDGAVVHGPATAPQPVLDHRVVGGRVQVRVRPIPGVPAS